MKVGEKKGYDYITFGMNLIGRNWVSGSENYRFGFNNYENDDELYGNNNGLDFESRIYDSRLGRFLSIDSDFKKYPSISPYNYASNNPILYIDINGEGPWAAILAAAVEYTGQVIANRIQGKSWGDSFFGEIDWVDVGVAAGEGMILGPGGISNSIRRKVIAIGAIELTKALVDGTVNKGMHIETNPKDIAVETGLGIVSNGLGEGVSRGISAMRHAPTRNATHGGYLDAIQQNVDNGGHNLDELWSNYDNALNEVELNFEKTVGNYELGLGVPLNAGENLILNSEPKFSNFTTLVENEDGSITFTMDSYYEDGEGGGYEVHSTTTYSSKEEYEIFQSVEE